ncbi:MAG: integrase arm-type DNA-binding domain-containing protein [Desulfuromonadales bacterium]|nr:integrase arm-type DNA-binding domain-containing protein [Desulfuromonadales bacterium]
MPKRIPPLSDIQVKNAKPKASEYKLSDGYGLHLLVTPTGGKLWRLQYRFDGKQKMLSFGAYPVLSLADARQRREDAKKLLANEVDPGAAKKAQKAIQGEQAADSFEMIAREWMVKFSTGWSAVHAATIKERLERDVFPYMGAKPVTEIKAPELLTVLRRVESRGALDTAHRIRNHCGKVFKYAVATGRAERDPSVDLQGALPPVKFGHRAAPTDPKKLAPLLKAIEDYQGSFIVKCAMQLLPMLFVRPGELRHMEWTEIDFEAAQWNIPAEKMKMKQAHIVPLPPQALHVLDELKPLTGHSKYVLPCHRTPLRCMSDNAINAALRRMGFEKSEVTAHGFRATARTMLHEILLFPPDAIEAQLAHAVPDRLGRAYNRTQHLVERRKMMDTWANYLNGLKAGAQVIPFKQKAA